MFKVWGNVNAMSSAMAVQWVAIYIAFAFLDLNPFVMSLSGNIFANKTDNSSQD